jgi:hypothetical protein
MVGAAIGAAIALSGVATYLNYEAQKDNLEYQKDLQQDIFAREDTSIARRVKDLQASGLSPVLAAGQGAGSGAVVQTHPPQMGDMSQAIIGAMQLMKMDADISSTYAQKDYLEAQANRMKTLLPQELQNLQDQQKNIQANTNLANANSKLSLSNANLSSQNARASKIAADNIEATGTSGSNFISQLTRDFFGSGSKAVEGVRNSLKNKQNNVPKKPNLPNNIHNQSQQEILDNYRKNYGDWMP